MEEAAVKKTKGMRRNLERRHGRPTQVAISPPAALSGEAAVWEEEIQPFPEVILP